MARHTRAAGVEWIAFLTDLGAILGYFPNTEFNVASGTRRNAPSDVAWLRNPEASPLFIFEVESLAGANMAHNALKVFGQSTSDFEKPLFFFHLVVTGGSRSVRPASLAVQLNAHNYRIYLLGEPGVPDALVKDVLRQHRRVASRVDVRELFTCLSEVGGPTLDVSEILSFAEGLGFAAEWGPAYGRISVGNVAALPEFQRKVRVWARNDSSLEWDYGTWLGLYYQPLLHLALQAHFWPERGQSTFDALRQWQDESFPKPMSPWPGQNLDFDNFTSGWAAYLWALTFALMRRSVDLSDWILAEMDQLLGPPERRYSYEIGAFSAIWILHVAAAAGHESHFDQARAFLNAGGGAPEQLLCDTPSRGGDLNDFDEWVDQLEDGRIDVPTMDAFKRLIGTSYAPSGAAATLAIAELVGDERFDSGPLLVRLLRT